jgi:hypothetical protein
VNIFILRDLKTTQANRLKKSDSTLNKDIAEILLKTSRGIETALGKEEKELFDKFFPRDGWILFDHPTSSHLPSIRKKLDELINYFKSLKKRTTSASLAPHYDPIDLQKYEGEI